MNYYSSQDTCDFQKGLRIYSGKIEDSPRVHGAHLEYRVVYGRLPGQGLYRYPW